MTSSPLLSVFNWGTLTGDWSHRSGARHGLMNPAPKARMMMEMVKAPRAPLAFLMTAGMAGMTRMMWAIPPIAERDQSGLTLQFTPRTTHQFQRKGS
jgi:hypothetical protein